MRVLTDSNKFRACDLIGRKFIGNAQADFRCSVHASGHITTAFFNDECHAAIATEEQFQNQCFVGSFFSK